MKHVLVCLALSFVAIPQFAQAQKLDEMSLERWKKLRETERYQLNIAEGYYRDKNWKISADEYEKFLSLYEKSEGAPYAQLKWSLCQVQLRKQNTAIKDGFQTVIDYWPESPEAIAAAFHIAHTYKAIGQLPKAKPAYRNVLAKHADHVVATHAMSDLVEIATLEKDTKTQLEFLRKLTFDVKRTNNGTNGVCTAAAQQLTTLSFETGNFEEGEKALATVYAGTNLPVQLVAYLRAPLSGLINGKNSKPAGEKLADAAITHLRAAIPSDLSKDAGKELARQYWYALADVNAIAQRDDRVLATYEGLAKALGQTDEAYGRLASFFKSRNKYDDARSTYRKYEDPLAGLAAVAYSFREQGNYDAAVPIYNQLTSQDASHAVKWKAELAATYRAAKKTKLATDTYSELIALDSPGAAKWRWEMATTFREGGQWKEAIAHYRQCDNFPENYRQMALCHRQLKEYSEAILLYNQIVGSADTAAAAAALLQVGYTREDAGQKEQAIQTFQAVCKKFPKDSHASTAHAHLQNKYKISVTLGGAKDEGSEK